MRTSEQLDAIGKALAAAQGEIEPAAKDRTNPAFRSKYADLTSVWEACRAAIAKHGLSLVQEVTGADDGIAVTTRLLHASGQWIELGPTPIPVSKRDAQGTGSAITYGKRYALAAALGVVADDDDDGNAAARAKPEPPARSAASVAPLVDRYPDVIPDVQKAKTVEVLNEIWRALSEPARADLKQTFAERRRAIETSMLNA